MHICLRQVNIIIYSFFTKLFEHAVFSFKSYLAVTLLDRSQTLHEISIIV